MGIRRSYCTKIHGVHQVQSESTKNCDVRVTRAAANQRQRFVEVVSIFLWHFTVKRCFCLPSCQLL